MVKRIGAVRTYTLCTTIITFINNQRIKRTPDRMPSINQPTMQYVTSKLLVVLRTRGDN